MKLYIDLQDYKELENIVERRNNKNLYQLFDILLMIMSLLVMLLSFYLFFAFKSLKYMVIAFILGFSFFLLGAIMDIKHDNLGVIMGIKHNNCQTALKKSLLIKDLKFPIKILNYHTSNNDDDIKNLFYFEYFDNNDILQSKKNLLW